MGGGEAGSQTAKSVAPIQCTPARDCCESTLPLYHFPRQCMGSSSKLPPWASHRAKERQAAAQKTDYFAALQLPHSGSDRTNLARLASLLSRSGLPRLWVVGCGAPKLHAKVPCPAGMFPQTSAQILPANGCMCCCIPLYLGPYVIHSPLWLAGWYLSSFLCLMAIFHVQVYLAGSPPPCLITPISFSR